MAGVLAFANQIQKNKAAAFELRTLAILSERETAVVEAFLVSEGIGTLEELEIDTLLSYRAYIHTQHLGDNREDHYAALLESVALCYFRPDYEDFCNEIDTAFPQKSIRAIRNKVEMFLMLLQVKDASEITWHHRSAFEAYLSASGCVKKVEYIKLMDRIKLSAIQKECSGPIARERKLSLINDVIYLGYHPDYKIAMEFYYRQSKEELVFDMTLPATRTVKMQIVSMLNDVLARDMKRKKKREMYLVPLKLFYLYCVRSGIEDIEQLLRSDVEGFRKSLEGNVGSKTGLYMEIIYSIRKFLFLSAKETNWDANVWFMERFDLKDYRANPANYVDAFRFDKIEDDQNRALMKEYMKAQIGIGKRAIATIQCHYNRIMAFLAYCDKEKISAAGITPVQVDAYFSLLDLKETKNETFNVAISSINDFFRYLHAKGKVGEIPFEASYYHRKCVYQHSDRSVSPDNQLSLLSSLKYFPEHLRLICLIIWATGIRVNEACSVLGGGFFHDGMDAYMTVNQYKMTAEKTIPIPETLYDLMKEYIRKNNVGSQEFVFKSHRGGAYQAGTFRTQVQRLCEKYGIGDADFIYRPHDFRHTVGTELFDAGVSLQAIRDYHGHRDENMTKQYIDYVPAKTDEANREYFRNHSLLGGIEE